jgi:uncharacterized protein (DUF2141 family)
MAFAHPNRMRLLLATMLLAIPAQADAPPALEISIEGFHSNDGRVQCDVFSAAEPKDFPTRRDKAIRSMTAPVRERRARCVFTDLPAGTYAVSVFHDENANGKVDTNFLGIPKEGLASSRNARGFLGPPKFKDASFPYPGPDARMTLTLTYL